MCVRAPTHTQTTHTRHNTHARAWQEEVEDLEMIADARSTMTSLLAAYLKDVETSFTRHPDVYTMQVHERRRGRGCEAVPNPVGQDGARLHNRAGCSFSVLFLHAVWLTLYRAEHVACPAEEARLRRCRAQ